MGYMGNDWATSSNPNYNFAEEQKNLKRIQEEVEDEIFGDVIEGAVDETTGKRYCTRCGYSICGCWD